MERYMQALNVHDMEHYMQGLNGSLHGGMFYIMSA